MIAEIISIGDELLIGQTINTNSSWIAEQLNLLGIRVLQITTISDNKQHILSSLESARKNADIVLVTGGLGPTKDDITKPTICEYFDSKLITNQDVLKDVENIILPRVGRMNELNAKQAEVPDNAIVIRNPIGTAPILWFEKENTVFIFMPGVPFEMKNSMETEILPRLKAKFKMPVIVHKNVLVTGIGESMLAEKIETWEDHLPDYIHLAYLPSPGQIKLRLSGYGNDSNLIQSSINQEVAKLQKLIPEFIFGYDNDTLESVIGKLLINNNLTLSTAESCTGGNIAHLITSVSGSSVYFTGSIVAYSNNVKTEILKVQKETIEAQGAVSQIVVEQMVNGVQQIFKTDCAIAVSGVAGPGGGTPEKPVGTVWIAIKIKEKLVSQKFMLGDNRERNILRATYCAINMLRLNML